MAGSLAFTESELTISAGSITPTRTHHSVDTAGDSSTDDLDTMSTASVSDGAIVILHAENAGRTVVVKHGTGNLNLFAGSDLSLDDLTKSIVFQRRGATWYELAPRSRNTVVQQVYVEDGAVATGTTGIPFDDTIPQNTEGDEYMTLAITPSSTTNILKVDVVAHSAFSVAGGQAITAALFQDSTAGALAASVIHQNTSDNIVSHAFTHRFAAGATSETTLKVRIGGPQAGTLTFNGTASTRQMGGAMVSSITITEIAA